MPTTANWIRELQAYELYKQTYPRDVTPYVNLAATYIFNLGEFEKALPDATQAIQVDPDEVRRLLLIFGCLPRPESRR